MELRRARWGAAIRLAIALSVTAGLVALALDAAGVARSTIVLAVIVTGFAASWVRTEQVARAHRRQRTHRVVSVPLHGVHHSVS
jgi:hypothetical protein